MNWLSFSFILEEEFKLLHFLILLFYLPNPFNFYKACENKKEVDKSHLSCNKIKEHFCAFFTILGIVDPKVKFVEISESVTKCEMIK